MKTAHLIRQGARCAMLMLTVACTERLVGVDASRSNDQLFTLVWRDFDRYYASFPIKQVDWQAVYQRYRPEAQRAASAAELAATIGRMLAELKDGHVDLAMPPQTYYQSLDKSHLHTYFDPRSILRSYATSSRMTGSRNMRYQMVSADVGYLWIASFAGTGWSNEMDGVLDELRAAKTLIIDLRDNGGGNSATAEEIAGRLISARYRYGWVRYRNGPRHEDFADFTPQQVRPAGPRQFAGPVLVLTNRKVASSAEHFVLAVRGRPNTAILGDTTLGSVSNPMIRELPNGWTYRLPQWILYDAEKRVVEDVGIAPTHFVAHTAADSVAGRDPQMEAAMAKAREAHQRLSARRLPITAPRNGGDGRRG